MRPNILYIHSHDTGRYIRPYGHAVETPRLQQLANEGILFRQAFSVAPTCTPSRAGLLTGQYPHSAGMLGLAHRGFSLNDYNQHLVHTLRRADYYSALIGVQHVASASTAIGYDEIRIQNSPVPGAPPGTAEQLQNAPGSEEVATAAADFLNNIPSQPFFLSIGFYDTHREFPSPDVDDDPRYCLVPPILPDTPQTRQDMAGFKAGVKRLDQSIGVVLDSLATKGLAENTLVICTTDHGLAFPGMKCTLTDHGLGVMLIVRGPGGFTGGRLCEAMISQIDLFPTICELLEIDRPAWLQGNSIMPLVRAETDQIRDEIFAEINYHAAYEPQRAVRTHRWKYIRRFDGRDRPVLPNIDDGPSKEILLENGLQNRPLPTEQLFDLIFDPAETHNLVNDAAHATILTEMRRRLDNWMQTTDDPLLHGPIAAPPAAKFNDVNGISPGESPLVAPHEAD
jgi:arylsulfatase A-like enzyme